MLADRQTDTDMLIAIFCTDAGGKVMVKSEPLTVKENSFTVGKALLSNWTTTELTVTMNNGAYHENHDSHAEM